MRVHRADMSLRDVTIARDGKRGYRVQMMSCTGSAQRILGIWRKLVKLRLDTERDGWLSFARGGLGQVLHEMGSRWKSQNRKIVPLSPYVEKPLNSKVIKSFVPELRSHYVSFKFRHSYVLSLWTFDVRFTHMVQMDRHSLSYKHLNKQVKYVTKTVIANLKHIPLTPNKLSSKCRSHCQMFTRVEIIKWPLQNI